MEALALPAKVTGVNQQVTHPAPLQMNVTSDTANLAVVRHAVEQFCRDCGMEEVGVGDVGLCVNEAMANVTRHAYRGKMDQPIRVEAQLLEGEVVVRIRDWGPGTQPPSTVNHDPLTPGGLGMVCLRQLMAQVKFQTLADGMLLTMTRKLKHGRSS